MWWPCWIFVKHVRKFMFALHPSNIEDVPVPFRRRGRLWRLRLHVLPHPFHKGIFIHVVAVAIACVLCHCLLRMRRNMTLDLEVAGRSSRSNGQQILILCRHCLRIANQKFREGIEEIPRIAFVFLAVFLSFCRKSSKYFPRLKWTSTVQCSRNISINETLLCFFTVSDCLIRYSKLKIG